MPTTNRINRPRIACVEIEPVDGARFRVVLGLHVFARCVYVCCRQVSTDEGERKAREEGVLFIETSAKAGFNVKALFRTLATSLPGAGAGSPTTPAESNLIDIKLQSAPPVDSSGSGGCSC